MNTFTSSFSTITVGKAKASHDFDLSVSSKADMEGLVKSFQNNFKHQSAEFSNAARALEVASHDALYSNLGAALAIALMMMEQGNLQFTIQVLQEHGLGAARKGANQYRPIVDLLFGKWVTRNIKGKKDETETVFVRNRSAEKYAKVLRYLASKGISPANAAAYIQSNGKMEGILDLDTKAHAKTDVDEQEIEAAISSIHAAAPLASLSPAQAGLEKGDKRKLVALWGEVINGKVHIRGALPTGEDAISAHIRKVATKIAPALASQQAKEDEEEIYEGVPDAPSEVAEMAA